MTGIGIGANGRAVETRKTGVHDGHSRNQSTLPSFRSLMRAQKELEKYREEYDQAAKKDKEIERVFRKEFAVYDFFFEPLLKLFKKRDPVHAPSYSNH
jgi:hypothetical protein